MNFTRSFQGIIIGALFSGVILAICEGLIVANSAATGELGLKSRDFWWLAMILGGLLGLFIGGIIGGVVSELNLNVIRSGGYVFIILVIPVFFILFSGDKFDDDIKKSAIAFLAIETITGIFVSLITSLLCKES